MTVAQVGVVAGLNLGGMLLTFQAVPIQDTAVTGVEAPIPFTLVLVTFLTLLPLAVLFGWIFLGVAAASPSFKGAQNALTPVYLLVLTLAMLPVFRGIDFGPLLAITPVAGVSFLIRGLITGGASASLGFLMLSSTTVYAVGSLALGSSNVWERAGVLGWWRG